jgi:hypothetical protein
MTTMQDGAEAAETSKAEGKQQRRDKGGGVETLT